MFGRIYKYSFLQCVRDRYVFFWCLLFPIILGTLFKVSFGDVNEKEMTFHQISVAYLEGEGARTEFKELLIQLEEEEKLVKIVEVKDEQEAKKLLKEEEIAGIYKNETEISLMVKEESIATSILKSIEDQYNQTMEVFQNIAMSHPDKIELASKVASGTRSFLKESNITEGKMDMYTNYFYALIAMNCLYGCFVGLTISKNFKANLSDIAARILAASTNRFVVLLADVAAKISAQTLCTIIGACYLKYVLKVDIGDKYIGMFVIILLGCSIGVMLGAFMGAIGKLDEGVRQGMAAGVSMFSCFLSGLMAGDMYQIIEQNAPIVNRINPASLVVNSFYSLNIYENNTQYFQSIGLLLGISVILFVSAFLMLRRERYASL